MVRVCVAGKFDTNDCTSYRKYVSVPNFQRRLLTNLATNNIVEVTPTSINAS